MQGCCWRLIAAHEYEQESAQTWYSSPAGQWTPGHSDSGYLCPLEKWKKSLCMALMINDDDEYTALPYSSSPSWPDSFHSTGITISSKHLGGKLNKSPLSRLPSMSSSVAGSSQSHRTEALLSGQIARTEVFHTIHISLLRVNLSILTFTYI